MDVYTAIAWIHGRKKFSKYPSLTRVQHLLHLLGNPEKNIKAVHIAGTNGKGSTVAYLCRLFRELDYKVGSFTSPYVEAFNERIGINGMPISDSELIHLIQKIQPLVEEMDQQEELSGCTEFEITTAMMFDYFMEKQVDIALIEVGLGGIYDSTNVICQPLVTGISSIGYDHMDLLGNTLEEIAKEKMGIFKPQRPVVLGKMDPEITDFCKDYAQSLECPVYCYGNEYTVDYLGRSSKKLGEKFNYKDEMRSAKRLLTPLIGHHQVENVAFALQIFDIALRYEHRSLSNSDVQHALAKVEWPGRMEIYQNEPLIVLDGAHNVPAMQRLVETLADEYTDYKIHILFAALKTKEYKEMIAQLQTLENIDLTLTSFDTPKALPISTYESYKESERLHITDNWRKAFFDLLKNMDDKKEMVVVTGSLYFLSEVRHFLTSGIV